MVISASGSYRLTSNLVVPNENTDGIQVTAHSVSIDLNGFEIRGPVTCSGSPLTCTPSSGTGSGVETYTNTIRGVAVRNGSITGMGNYGVWLGEQAEVRDLRLRHNRSGGVSASSGSTISGNSAGTVTGGVNMGNNSCNGATTCP